MSAATQTELRPPPERVRRRRARRSVDRHGVTLSCAAARRWPKRRRDRVLAVAEELRWRPSRLARAFSEQSHGAVGIVFPDLGGPYYPRLIAGFEATAAERGAAVLIAATHGRANAAELVSELADRVDGVVIACRTVSDEVIASLERRERPVVLLARPPLGHLPAVRAANTAPAVALTEHVIGHGCRRIVFVGAPDLSPDVAERWRGVRRALRAAGIDTAAALVRTDGLDVHTATRPASTCSTVPEHRGRHLCQRRDRVGRHRGRTRIGTARSERCRGDGVGRLAARRQPAPAAHHGAPADARPGCARRPDAVRHHRRRHGAVRRVARTCGDPRQLRLPEAANG